MGFFLFLFFLGRRLSFFFPSIRGMEKMPTSCMAGFPRNNRFPFPPLPVRAPFPRLSSRASCFGFSFVYAELSTSFFPFFPLRRGRGNATILSPRDKEVFPLFFSSPKEKTKEKSAPFFPPPPRQGGERAGPPFFFPLGRRTAIFFFPRPQLGEAFLL